MSIVGSPAYDTFLIVSLLGRPIYDPNSLRPNPNPKKPVSNSCCVCRLGRTLTPLLKKDDLTRRIASPTASPSKSHCCYRRRIGTGMPFYFSGTLFSNPPRPMRKGDNASAFILVLVAIYYNFPWWLVCSNILLGFGWFRTWWLTSLASYILGFC